MTGPHVEVYRDAGGAWRWRQRAANGQTTSSSGESFTRKWSAKRAAKRANPGLELYVVR